MLIFFFFFFFFFRLQVRLRLGKALNAFVVVLRVEDEVEVGWVLVRVVSFWNSRPGIGYGREGKVVDKEETVEVVIIIVEVVVELVVE